MLVCNVTLYAESKNEEVIKKLSAYVEEVFCDAFVNVKGGQMDADFSIEGDDIEGYFVDMPTDDSLYVRCMLSEPAYDFGKVLEYNGGVWIEC